MAEWPIRWCLAGAFVCLGPFALAQEGQDFPPGPGREIVQTRCGICHQVRYARSSAYSPQGWRQRLAQMRNVGLQLTDEEFEIVAQYLATNFLERPRPDAVIVPGDIEVEFIEWEVPTPGSLPRDVAIAADGTAWFTGLFANTLIHLDLQSGEIVEHTLEVFNSGPTGIDIDSNGNIWFTAGLASHFYQPAYIGVFDPTTFEITEHQMPEGRAGDPADLAIAANGTVWFTAQDAGDIGRIDPQTGRIEMVPMGSPDTTPFSIAFNTDGIAFVGLRGASAIARIDPENLEISEFALGASDSEPRRLAITSDNIVWYTDIDRGQLGRLDPATGEVEEYLSPSGPLSEPHAITVIDDIIWYVEAAARPNALVRFDPRTKRFQSWPLSGYATVREFAVTQDGNLVFAMGSLNRLAMAVISER